MTSLLLEHQGGFAWHRGSGICVKGYAFDGAGRYREADGLLGYFLLEPDGKTFPERLREANGCFAVIVETDRRFLAAVDPVRSIPLFYAVQDGRFLIGDDVYAIQRELGGSVETDPVSREEVLRVGYATGPRTKDPRIRQIEAGEWVAWDKGSARAETGVYFSHAHGDYTDKSEETLLNELDALTARWTDRLIRSAGGRRMAIPLSGGYDSRYIACALKRARYDNVVCYSYGAPASFEWRTAREVASRLGYPIHVVEYSGRNWRAALESPRFMEYCRLAAQRCAIPNIQDLSARLQLESTGAVRPDDILIPGFCGDLQGGSYVPDGALSGRGAALMEEGIARYLYRYLFTLRRTAATPEMREAIEGRIREYTDRFPIRDIQDYCSVLEDWFTRHKVARFVVNALRTHELFGNEWRLPLWDQELLAWWYRIPLMHRAGSRLYHRYLFERLFEPMGVAFRRRSWSDRAQSAPCSRVCSAMVSGAKWILRRTCPGRLRKHNDIDAFDAASRLLLRQMPRQRNPQDFRNINSVMGAWCEWKDL